MPVCQECRDGTQGCAEEKDLPCPRHARAGISGLHEPDRTETDRIKQRTWFANQVLGHIPRLWGDQSMPFSGLGAGPPQPG